MRWIVSMMWTKPKILGTPPTRRRAQTAVLYESKILIFGGGNGSQALNDVHALDISDLERMEWEQLSVGGVKPMGRGYHSASIVGDKCLVFGGSDGSECFSDVSILDLGTSSTFSFLPLPHTDDDGGCRNPRMDPNPPRRRISHHPPSLPHLHPSRILPLRNRRPRRSEFLQRSTSLQPHFPLLGNPFPLRSPSLVRPPLSSPLLSSLT